MSKITPEEVEERRKAIEMALYSMVGTWSVSKLVATVEWDGDGLFTPANLLVRGLVETGEVIQVRPTRGPYPALFRLAPDGTAEPQLTDEIWEIVEQIHATCEAPVSMQLGQLSEAVGRVWAQFAKASIGYNNGVPEALWDVVITALSCLRNFEDAPSVKAWGYLASFREREGVR